MILQNLVITTDLDLHKSFSKIFFWDTRAEPYQSRRIKDHNDGKVSKTIAKLQNRERKRDQNARKSC